MANPERSAVCQRKTPLRLALPTLAILVVIPDTCLAEVTGSASCVAAPAGLIGWWPGEGDAHDFVSTHHGTLAGGAQAIAPGLVGQAFSFDGTNGYVQIPDSPALQLPNLTIEAWVCLSGLDSAGSGASPPGEQYIVFKQNSRTSDFEGFDLGKIRQKGQDSFRFLVGSASGQAIQLVSSTVITTNVWYHVAGVRGSNFLQLFVNGQLEHQTNVGFAQDYGSYPLYFGSSGQAHWDHKFKGWLDEVSLYNRALAAGEIASLYAAGAAGKCRTPRILVQPQSQSVVSGATTTFSVSAAGSPSLTYQWCFNGMALAAATRSQLLLSPVQPANAGSYTVVVASPQGSVTSTVATLTVLLPPSITVQPRSCTNPVGSRAAFEASVAGSPPLRYQWQHAGTNLVDDSRLSGTTTNFLVIASVQPTDTGLYALRVSNAVGTITSAPVTLTVAVPPTLTLQPASLGLVVGSEAVFSVKATGTPPLSYQWQHNAMALADGTRISGATATTLRLANVQFADTGNYQVLVTNLAGAVTSTVALLSVTLTPVAPAITLPPLSQEVAAGTNLSFSVTASGTAPLSFQWQKDGTNLANGGRFSGVTEPTLWLTNVQPTEAGVYRVVVTNRAGAVTSAAATLAVKAFLQASALVLVNSQSAKFLDFPQYLQPYLDNFGIPYSVRDICTQALGPEVGRYALLIIGHSQLDTNQLYLDSLAQAILSTAVSNGTGLVNFDNALASPEGLARYPFVQSVFGFAYGPGATGATVTFAPTEPGGQSHYITALHQTNEVLRLLGAMGLVNLSLPPTARAVARSGDKPLVVVQDFGQGRAVQWASYEWMATAVLGPLSGLDDLLWRSLVWAARKPFVMRGFPNLVTMRVDDLTGPFGWVHIANEVGFKPFLALFIHSISEPNLADLRALTTSGKATASVHSFTPGKFFFYDSSNQKNWPDSVMANYYAEGTRWHLAHGIPFPKSVIFHCSEVGANAFGGLKEWGVEFVLLEAPVGTQMYSKPTPWLVAGPYRLYEPPRSAASLFPLFYADFLPIPGHPELDGQFFNCYTEIRNVAPSTEWEGGQWMPINNDVATSVDRGSRHLKRALDSLVLATLFTHEPYLTPVSGTAWRAIVQGITNSLAAYNPLYVTLDYANQYVRATRTSRVLESAYDPASGQLTVTLSGKTDLETLVQVFASQSNALSPSRVTIPAFSGTTTLTAAMLPVAPTCLNPPLNRTSLVGSTASFGVSAAGTAPLRYQWLKDQTNVLRDNAHLHGTSTAVLTISNVVGTDAGSYRVLVSNAAGQVISPAATLTVWSPPTIKPLTLVKGGIVLSWNANAGAVYRVQFKGSLQQTNWSEWLPEIRASGTAMTVTNLIGTSTQRFYRVLLLP